MTEQEKRSNLLESLRQISPMPADDDEAQTEELLKRYKEVIQALRPIVNENCIEPLIASFGYGDAFEGYWPTLHLLEKLPINLLHEALLKALESGPDGARMWSALMLGRQRNEGDVATLIKVADDPCELVRVNAVRSLGWIGTPDALKAVRGKAQDSSPKVQEWVEEVLKA